MLTCLDILACASLQFKEGKEMHDLATQLVETCQHMSAFRAAERVTQIACIVSVPTGVKRVGIDIQIEALTWPSAT